MKTEIFLHALTSYFVIIDPIGTALVFHSLTTGGGRKYAVTMATRTVIISTAIVMAFGFWGETLLSHLGIGIDSLRVAGGFLLFYTAFNMITKPDSDPERPGAEYSDISVYPMSIPLIAGPGCLTLTILLFSGSNTKMDIVPVGAAVFLIYGFTFLAFIMSSGINRLIGKTGGDIIKRLLGVILAALAIQFITDGLRQLLA